MESLLYNKKAGFDYEIMEKFQAGIVLVGFEVKSIREKKGNLIGAHVSVRGDEAFLLNSFIPPYQEKNTPTSYDPYHVRKLLLTKKEITDLRKSESQKGLTIIPISMYNKGRKIKVEIAVVRGKKKFDKRQTEKKKSSKREMERTLKSGQ